MLVWSRLQLVTCCQHHLAPFPVFGADIWQTSLMFLHLLLRDCELLSVAQTCENIVLLLATESLLAWFARAFRL